MRRLSPPEILEPRRRQLRVAYRVLDVAMAQVSLQCPCVVPFACQSVAAGVPKHVWVGLEAELGLSAGPLDHASEPCSAEGCSTFRCEHERRLGLLFSLEAPQSP